MIKGLSLLEAMMLLSLPADPTFCPIGPRPDTGAQPWRSEVKPKGQDILA